MEYEFGVGSSKYKLEAKTDDVAFFSMVMFIGNNEIPIAIYKPYKKVIVGKNILDLDNIDLFMNKNLQQLRNAQKSIKKIR